MKLPPPGPRRELALALLFVLAAAAVRLPRLGFPPEEVFDEVYHARAARSYLYNEPLIEWVHPPTSKILISVGVALFGYEPWAWRLAPALAGIALAPIFFLLARRTLPTERAAVLATVLLLTDGVYLVQSRTAMTNIFAVLFQVASALFVLRAVLPERMSARDMLVAGLFIGLALSSRWTSLWATGYLGLVVLAVRRLRVLRWRELGLVALAFAVLPAAVYAGSYWSVPIIRPRNLEHLIETQKAIWHYHATLQAQHHYFSRWYTWPWLYRPTWYYYKQIGYSIYGIVALGNPALWWTSVPVTLWALISGARARDPRRLFSGFGFCALYLPWGASPRTLNFSHYLFEALPYACLSMGMLLDREWNGRWGFLARGFLVLTVLLFLYFLPILIAIPLPAWIFYPKGGWRPWLWFSTWI